MKTVVYTLNINNYAPEIVKVTRPFLQGWVDKIGANLFDITERRFPEWPVTYEKLQIHHLAKEHKADWIVYVDADALIHPDFFDLTSVLSRDTVLHYNKDFAPNRWAYDDYFRRDGRNIGSGNWFTAASSWCLDLWRPLDDLTPAEAISRIYPTMQERQAGIEPAHLIDDFALSRNIARFGLKFTTLTSELAKVGQKDGAYLYHRYTIPIEEKLEKLKLARATWLGLIPAPLQE